MSNRLDAEATVFALLRALTLVGGVTALLIVPLRPEHRLHLTPLLVGFVIYKALLFAVLLRWTSRAREVFLATLAADLGVVFLLVWFTGGGDSHFYLLFFLLVALNAHYFGPAIGLLAAALASALLGLANWLAPPPAPWTYVGSRALLLGLLGLALGHVAARERAARARAEALHREKDAAMARLARAEQLAAVGRLSAKMAHEVRNPLGAINLDAEMLTDILRDAPGPSMAEAREIAREIRDEVRALAALTDEYLVAARLRRPRPEKESLNDLAADLVAFLRATAERQGVALDLDLDPALPLLPLDRAMVRQAAHNIVRNSLEMLPHGGRVVVGTRGDAESAVLSVVDSGPGVDPAAAPHLFEPFFTTKARGTGLGLSIALQVAREHGGDVVWRNRPEGGTEFDIRLPLGGAADG